MEAFCDNCSHGINVSADIHRSSKRNSFIDQPVDPCLLNSLLMLSLFAFDLHFAIASILFQLRLAPDAPLKFVATAFAVSELDGGVHLNADLLRESLKAAPCPLRTLVSGNDDEAQPVRTWACAPLRCRRRPIEREGQASGER
jgi:hypothetical protein